MTIKPLRGVFTPNQRSVYLRCHFGNGSIHLGRARRVSQKSAQPGLNDAAGLPFEKYGDPQTSLKPDLKPDLEIPVRERQPTSISGCTKDASLVKKPEQLGAVQSQLKSNLPAQKLSTRRRMQTAKKKAVEAGGGVSRMSEDINFSCHPATKTTETMVVGSLKAKDLKISAIPNKGIAVPGLSYGLERVLFNPGVHSLQDHRSRVFNFDPYLQTIMPVKEFNFNALNQFITSSKDENLKKLAEAYGKRYVGSSSSMTGVLSHLHYLLSGWREVNTSMLSTGFKHAQECRSFTAINKIPCSVFLIWRDGTYAIDSDKEFETGTILTSLGMSLEKLLTLDTKDFERYRKSNPDQWPTKTTSPREAYHYSTLGNLLMRSQLDAYDARLPGTGIFDLKSRSVVSIRMNPGNYELGIGYQIKSNQGNWESYEREYYEMIRSAFLKYSLQVRMGSMDGIFVAYHNVEKIFGFQYISLPELDNALHGSANGDSTSNTRIGDQEFAMSLDLFRKILDEATKRYPETSLRIHFETRDANPGEYMYVYAEPMTEAQVEEIQSKNLAEIEEFERSVGLTGTASSKEHEQDKEVQRADIEASVQAAMIKEEPSLPGASMDPESSFVIANNMNFDLSHKHKGNENLNRENAIKHRDDENLTVSSSVGDGHVNPGDGTGDEAARKVNDEKVVEVSDEEFDREMDGDEAKENAVEDADRDTDEDETDRNNKGNGELSEIQAGEEHGVLSEIVGLDNFGCGQIGPIDEESQQSLTDDDTNDSSTEVNNLDSREVSKEPDMIGAEVAGARDKPLDVPAKVLAMTLRHRNKVDGGYIRRPLELTEKADWTIEFLLTEEKHAGRAWSHYQACKRRRQKGLELAGVAERPTGFLKNLRSMSKKGAAWSKMMDKRDEGQYRVVLKPDVADDSERYRKEGGGRGGEEE